MRVMKFSLSKLVLSSTMLVGAAFLWQSTVQASTANMHLSDQESLTLNIYQGNFAEVKSQRRVEINEDTTSLRWHDLPDNYDYDSFEVRSSDVKISNISRDLFRKEDHRVISQFVGKELIWVQDSLSGLVERKAKLVAMSNEGPVLQFENGIELAPPGYPRFPEMPEIKKQCLPSVGLAVTEAEAGSAMIEAVYQVRDIDWDAQYRIVLNPAMDQLELQSKINLENYTNRDFDIEQLTLIAGESEIEEDYGTPEHVELRSAVAMSSKSMVADSAPIVEDSVAVADRHVFPVKGAKALPAGSSVKFDFFEPVMLSVEKRYELNWHVPWGLAHQGKMPLERPEVFISFDNNEANKLGFALPEGNVRLYAEAAEGLPNVLLAEQYLNNTASEEEIEFSLGRSFDISARHQQKSFEYLSKDRRSFETEYEVTLRNSKDQAVTVDLQEHLPASTKVVEANAEYKQDNPRVLHWELEIPAGEVFVLTYKIRVDG